ncbi:MAG TPA: CvpA family protein [Bryobacteraceae bacterium]|jgi:membrane protein required for colicin V production|nr:CvpA family protein [Bryobacteraceae bacterium]
MPSFTWIDVALTLIILWSVATGLRSGLARVVVGFVAAIAAFIAGFWFYRLVAVKLAPWLGDSTLANFAGFIIVFVGVLIIGSMIGAALSKMFAWIGLSWINRILGGAAGFVRGILLIAALLDVVIAFAPSPTPEVLQRSLVVPYVSTVSAWLISLAPHSLRQAFEEELDNLRRYWSSPSKEKTQTAASSVYRPVQNRSC